MSGIRQSFQNVTTSRNKFLVHDALNIKKIISQLASLLQILIQFWW